MLYICIHISHSTAHARDFHDTTLTLACVDVVRRRTFVNDQDNGTRPPCQISLREPAAVCRNNQAVKARPASGRRIEPPDQAVKGTALIKYNSSETAVSSVNSVVQRMSRFGREASERAVNEVGQRPSLYFVAFGECANFRGRSIITLVGRDM